MDSYMEIDDSGYKAEVVEHNLQKEQKHQSRHMQQGRQPGQHQKNPLNKRQPRTLLSQQQPRVQPIQQKQRSLLVSHKQQSWQSWQTRQNQQIQPNWYYQENRPPLRNLQNQQGPSKSQDQQNYYNQQSWPSRPTQQKSQTQQSQHQQQNQENWRDQQGRQTRQTLQSQQNEHSQHSQHNQRSWRTEQKQLNPQYQPSWATRQNSINTREPLESPLAKRSRVQFESDLVTSTNILQPPPPRNDLNTRLRNIEVRNSPVTPRASLRRVDRPSPAVVRQRRKARQRVEAGPALRRVGGFVVSLLSCSAFLLGSVWSRLRGQGSHSTVPAPVEIVAVATNESGKKRRAVESPTSMTTPPDSRPGSQQEETDRNPEDVTWEFDPNMTIPTLPTLSDLGSPDMQSATPRVVAPTVGTMQEDSPRPSVSDETPIVEAGESNRQPPSAWPRDVTPASQKEEVEEPVQSGNEPKKGKSGEATKSSVAPEPVVQIPLNDGRPPGVRRTGVWLHSDHYPICQDRVVGPPLRTFPLPKWTLGPPQRLPASARGASLRAPKSREADAKVDQLVDRAEKLRLGTEDQQKLVETVRSSYRQRLAEERARKAQIAEAEAAAIAAKQKAAEEEAKRAALQKEAEDRERRVAEELKRRAASIIKPITLKWFDDLEHAMKGKGDKVLAQGPEGNELTRRDFGTLLAAPGKSVANAWLNDEIVNAWFGFLVQEKLEQAKYVKGSAAPYAAYNSAWYLKMRDEGAQSLKRWSRRKGIQNEKLLQAESVYMPINTGVHWILLIISPKARTIEVLDSMRGPPSKYFSYARKWLEMELGSKYVANEWTESNSASSLQDNSDDCGAFTCLNGLASATQKDYAGVTACKMQEARRMMGAVLLNGGFTGDFAL